MLLDEIATYLTGAGVGSTDTTAAWAVFKGLEPNAPEQSITLFETGGLANEFFRDTPLDRPTFQVRVRGNSTGYAAARTKIGDVRASLELIGNQSLSGRYYVHVVASGEPMSLGIDENQLPRLVMNFRALRSRT